MTEPKAIDVETVPPDQKSCETLALARVESGAVSTERMTVDELKANLNYIREIMQNVMREGQDYGKVPGCGDKPSLLQPGAQKLCMTFQLQDRVKKEEVRDLSNFHREYAFTVSLVSATGRQWDGVGTCSTLEGKYRYRKADRRCPKCGKNTIIQGKAEFGGGWLCFKKKGGCGEKFAEDDARITSQPGGTVEHENPADYWNTVRKMAFKRALVHAAINATNTSELWTQDVEDMPEVIPGARPPQSEPQKPPGQAATSPPSPQTTQSAPAAPTPKREAKAASYATEQTRQWMIKELDSIRDLAREYFTKLSDPTPLAPFEDLPDLPLRFVPINWDQLKVLKSRIMAFGNGEQAGWAFPPNPEPPENRTAKPAAASVAGALDKAKAATKPKDPEWWRPIIVTMPRKGMKKVEYEKNPDTIGSLHDIRHEDDDARKRLWGLVKHFQGGWTKHSGEVVPPTAAEIKCREALDAYAEWFEKNHPDEKL